MLNLNGCHFKYLKARPSPEIYCSNDVVITVNLFRKVQLHDILMAISNLVDGSDHFKYTLC